MVVVRICGVSETEVQLNLFLPGGQTKVDHDGHAELRLDGVGSSSVESADVQTPFDP